MASASVFAVNELENFEPVLSDGNSHALKELVVEEGCVFQLELIAGEGEAIVVDKGGVEVGFGEPGEPVHDVQW